VEQISFCQRIVKEGLSVRQVERLVKSRTPRRKARRTGSVDPDVRRLEEDLQRALGTKVRIRTTGKRGKIEIEFYSPDDFESLLGRLLGR
jgi:ParB family chromosome partitioning protein